MIYTFIHLRCFPDGPVCGGRTMVVNHGLSKFIRYKDKLENLGHFKYHDIHFTSLAFSSIWLTCWMKIFEIFWNSKIDKVDKIFGRPVNFVTIVHRPDLNLDPALILPVLDIALILIEHHALRMNHSLISIPWIFKNEIKLLNSP